MTGLLEGWGRGEEAIALVRPYAEAQERSALEFSGRLLAQHGRGDEGCGASLSGILRTHTLRTDARPKRAGRRLPPAEAAHGTYAAAWAGTKLRWKLHTDEKEHAALVKLADACPDTVVEYEVVP
ncbi:hypothetical protein ABZ590_02785 [Streptomyces hirsutus]|uniref:hypothetical protein n=1 Tax=Streptomyces hirsutus TaxID=35620 RepID=UPI0033E9F85B